MNQRQQTLISQIHTLTCTHTYTHTPLHSHSPCVAVPSADWSGSFVHSADSAACHAIFRQQQNDENENEIYNLQFVLPPLPFGGVAGIERKGKKRDKSVKATWPSAEMCDDWQRSIRTRSYAQLLLQPFNWVVATPTPLPQSRRAAICCIGTRDKRQQQQQQLWQDWSLSLSLSLSFSYLISCCKLLIGSTCGTAPKWQLITHTPRCT